MEEQALLDPYPGADCGRLCPGLDPRMEEAVPSDSLFPDAGRQPFGSPLEPALVRACRGQLSSVCWFRTDWQHGGALTGYATYQDERGGDHPVVVKLPVVPHERQWLIRLQRYSDVVPRVYAQGESLNGYDMAWVIMERLPHGPLGPSWNGHEFDLLVDAVGRFYNAARDFPVTGPALEEDWELILQRAREQTSRLGHAREKRWNKALKQARRKLKDWVEAWRERPVDQWCHGDLHLANAMTRHPAPNGPALLLDFALTHPGNWVEDAVYLEFQYWAHRDQLGGRKICQLIARQRRALGLPVDSQWSRWASIRRAMLAIRTLTIGRHRNDPSHVQAALSLLEAQVGH